MKLTIMPVGSDTVLLPFTVDVDPDAPFLLAIRQALRVMYRDDGPHPDKSFDVCTGSAGIVLEPAEFTRDVASIEASHGRVFCIKPGTSFTGASTRDPWHVFKGEDHTS